MYSIYYFLVPAIINSQVKNGIIERVVKDTSGITLDITNPRVKMGLLPSIWFSADSFKIVEDNNSPLVVENLKLKLLLLPLVAKNLDIKVFLSDKINADCSFDKDFSFYIGNTFIPPMPDIKLIIKNSDVNVKNFDIALTDKKFNQKIKVKGDYFILDEFDINKNISFATKLKADINSKKSSIDAKVNFTLPLKKTFSKNDIVFDGSLKNFDLSAISPYLNFATKGEVKNIAGVVNIDAKTSKKIIGKKNIDCKIIFDSFKLLTKSGNDINIPKKINFISNLIVSKDFLEIVSSNIKFDNSDVELDGTIKRLDSNNPNLNLNVLTNKLKAENVLELLPNSNFSDVAINIPAMKKYGVFSDVNMKLNIKGNANKPKVLGYVNLSNLYILHPMPIPKATINMKFTGEKIDLDVHIPASVKEFVDVKGLIDMYGKKNANLHITSSKNVDLSLTETILNPVHEVFGFDLGPVPDMKISGLGNIDLKTKGNNSSAELLGRFNFNNAVASFNGIAANVEKGTGYLTFNKKDTHFVTTQAYLNSKPIKIEGDCDLNGKFLFNVNLPNQNLFKLVKILEKSPMLNFASDIPKMVEATSGNINLDFELKGKVKSIADFEFAKNVNASGNIKLLGNDFVVKNLPIKIKNVLGNVHFVNENADFDLYPLLGKKRLKIAGKIKDKLIYTKLNLNNVDLVFHKIPIKVLSGAVEINGNKVFVKKLNSIFDSKPVFINGAVSNVFKIPYVDIYISSKASQKFIDSYLNKKILYPVISKGDIDYTIKAVGVLDSLNIKTILNIHEGSSLYYMGATLGDEENGVKIISDADFFKDKTVRINNMKYDKLILSQNNKISSVPQLDLKGSFKVVNKIIDIENIKIKTINPTDARFFNVLFKKPLIKHGSFESNLNVSGRIDSPKLVGKLSFVGIDIPFLDTTIKNIGLNFKDKVIEIHSSGEFFSSAVKFYSVMNNSLKPPYVFDKTAVAIDTLNLDKFISSLDKLSIEGSVNKMFSAERKSSFDVKDVSIKSLHVRAKRIFSKQFDATNFDTHVSFYDEIFNVKDFKFVVAKGDVSGDFKYNLKTKNTNVDLYISDVSANKFFTSMLDLPNQLYGDLYGEVQLSCNAKTHKSCMRTLNGRGGFKVLNGRMPKLGSLEYLLKAGNLVKSGITGITINSLIELITPLRTGAFENINGTFSVKSGVSNDIQIFTKGRDLSLFLLGSYDFARTNADFDIYGRVSKKISNVLGAIGNTSINTLFNIIPGVNLNSPEQSDIVKNLNKIPGFEFNDRAYRIFTVKIKGDINGDNYVQSFKWVEE